MNDWPGGWGRGDDRDSERTERLGPRRGGDGVGRPQNDADPRPTTVLPPPAAPGSSPGDGAIGRTGKRPPAPPRKRDTSKIVRRILLAVLVLVIGWALVLGGYVMTHLNKTDALSDYSGRPGDTAGSNWLIVGSDSRAGLTREQQNRLKTGRTEGQRTDTIILLHVSESGEPTLVSLPRDSWVSIPGKGRNKLNAAFAVGGAPLMVRTVEQATGLRIDHYAEIGFAGVVGLTDAVGGVRLCLDKPIKDAKSGLDVKAGCQTMDGPTALAYVRARYFDPKGDLGRIERQQAYVGALMGEVIGARTFFDPFRQWELATAGTAALTVDDDTGPFDLVTLARQMRKLSHGEGTQTTVPVADPAYSTSAGLAVRWDRKAALQLFASLKSS